MNSFYIGYLSVQKQPQRQHLLDCFSPATSDRTTEAGISLGLFTEEEGSQLVQTETSIKRPVGPGKGAPPAGQVPHC